MSQPNPVAEREQAWGEHADECPCACHGYQVHVDCTSCEEIFNEECERHIDRN
jgi:hypothetical protein